jgi:hypothetical protein
MQEKTSIVCADSARLLGHQADRYRRSGCRKPMQW